MTISFECPEPDQPVATAHVKEKISWLDLCAGQHAAAVAHQLSAEIRLKVMPALAPG